MFRQGDVLLVRCNGIPRNAKPVGRENGRVVLAHGEATGHHHSFSDGVQLLERGEDRYLMVKDEVADLEHQEHGVIPVPKGQYKVIRQRQYDILEGVRRVMD